MSVLFSYLIQIIGVLSFVKAIFDWRKSQIWKESEFLSKEVKDFFGDESIKKVLLILDWNVRDIEISDKIITIDDDFLLSALKTHSEKPKFTRDEAKVRDLFDNFFDKLTFFNIYCKNGLISEKQVFDYFKYYLNILTKRGRKSERLIKTFDNYIDYYGYSEVREMLEKFKKYNQKNEKTLFNNFIFNSFWM